MEREGTAEREAQSLYRKRYRRVTELLDDIGVGKHLKGYNYLREGILLTLEDLRAMDVYESIAYNFETAPMTVQRNMRWAIEKAGLENTPSSFMASLADTIRTEEVMADEGDADV